ncbi:phosphatidylinositide phosphatase SAC2 [Echinococcus multilocularis]|uniref:Phosphatidylinositide phosphatase SAC2 n=1 Tax=Echinococcus multilocularis TaxID=6211 RepID=A0A068YD93_ECHMU|nr:phosphatidylinositide phosphatase SAC2 [Echinococcus multilocularis]
MEQFVEVFQTHSFYVLVRKPCALFIDRINGDATFKYATNMAALSDAVNLGVVEGVLGKFQCIANSNWHLLLISESEFVCSLHDGIEVRRISKIAILPISPSPLPKTFQLNKTSRNGKESISTHEQPSAQKQPAIVQAVQNTIKVASDIVNFKQKSKGTSRFEMRILEELEKLFEGESDQFYFARCGGDLTLWTQRRECRRLQGELCYWGDLKVCPRTCWPPIWCRYDESFVWNHRILQDLVAPALQYLHVEEGLPKLVTTSRSPSPVKESRRMESGMEMDETRRQVAAEAGQPTRLTECLCALESMLPPVISGFVKQHKLALHMWDVDGRISPTTSDPVTLTIISRRSRFRAGCRYRRRGIDEKGYVANYVETEQVLEVPSEVSVHVLSFLQIRGSVPVFWTQTGIKYKPPIQLHKSLSENQEAFRLHIERPLRKFDRLVVVNLAETVPGRQESKITEAFVRQLLLFNNPKVTYVGFDFHEYCKNLRFGNVSVLLEGIKDIIRDMQYYWLHRNNLMCKQESVFRVNCIDCLDRTNLVQSVFATSVIEIQLRRLGRLPPEVDLPVEFSRSLQSIWADNGDALSRHYTGTAAMKGDYTRTGFRTVNGLMKDGVSSMSRYYQRFGEIKRQAAIDFLLGHTNSPELRFLRNCSTADVPVKEHSSIEVSSLLAAVRSSCLQGDEDPFFEFVASSNVITNRKRLRQRRQLRRIDVRAFGMLTSKYLHIVRFVDDPLTNQQAHLRIPVSSITHIALGTESALFKQASPVLYIHFTTTSPHSNQPPMAFCNYSSKEVEFRSSDDASGESGVSAPSTVLKRFPLQQGTSGQYCLALRQAPFRLFNNYLVPISSAEEATDALHAVAESITVLLQSIDRSTDQLVLAETRATGISVMQRRFTSSLPTEFTRPLAPAACNALQQHHDCLYPFLLSLHPSRRPRRSRRVPVANLNHSFKPAQRICRRKNSLKPTPLNLSQTEEIGTSNGTRVLQSTGIKGSFGQMLKQSMPLVEKVFPAGPGFVKHNEQPSAHVNGLSDSEECIEAATEETDEEMLALDSSEVMEGKESRSKGGIAEQGVEPPFGSDVDDMPAHIIKPSHCSSISDLMYELEDAASIATEEEDDRVEGDDDENEKAGKLRISLSYSRSVPAHLEDVGCGQMPQLTNATVVASVCRPSSSPLLGGLFNFPPFLPSQVHEQSSNRLKTNTRLSRPVLTSEDQLLLPRSLSYDDRSARTFHGLSCPRKGVSDPQITCYRTLYGLAVGQRSPPRSPRVLQGKVDRGLQEVLDKHFQTFTIASIATRGECPSSQSRAASHLSPRRHNTNAIYRILTLRLSTFPNYLSVQVYVCGIYCPVFVLSIAPLFLSSVRLDYFFDLFTPFSFTHLSMIRGVFGTHCTRERCELAYVIFFKRTYRLTLSFERICLLAVFNSSHHLIKSRR